MTPMPPQPPLDDWLDYATEHSPLLQATQQTDRLNTLHQQARQHNMPLNEPDELLALLACTQPVLPVPNDLHASIAQMVCMACDVLDSVPAGFTTQTTVNAYKRFGKNKWYS